MTLSLAWTVLLLFVPYAKGFQRLSQSRWFPIACSMTPQRRVPPHTARRLSWTSIANQRWRTDIGMSVGHDPEQSISRKTLCKLNTSVMTVEELVSFLRRWAVDKVASGSAISLQEIPHGVEFHFKSAPSAWLKMRVVPSSQSLELEQTASVPSTLSAPVQSLITTVMNSLEESLSDDMMHVMLRPPRSSQTPQASSSSKRRLEDDVVVDRVRTTFNVTSDLEIVEIDDENDFDVAAIQRELRREAEVHAQLQNGSFWSNVWTVTDVGDQDTPDGVSEETAQEPVAQLPPHGESTAVATVSHQTAAPETVLPAAAAEVSSAVGTGSLVSRDSSHEEVFTWSNVPHPEANSHRKALLVTFLQQWADSYGQKGIGVSAAAIADGCRVTFLALEDAHLDVFVTVEPSSTTADGTSTIRVEDAVVTKEGGGAMLREQLQYPIQSIRESLQQELQRLDVPGMRAPAVIGATTPIANDDEGKGRRYEWTATVEAESILSNAGSAAFASIDEKDRVFRDVWQTIQSRETSAADAFSTVAVSAAQTEGKTVPFADPEVTVRAREIGVDVAEYNTPDMQSEAVKQLEVILRRTREQGMYRVLQEHHEQAPPPSERVTATNGSVRASALSTSKRNATAATPSAVTAVNTTLRSDEWSTLFTLGKEISELNLQKLLDRPSNSPYFESAEELQRPPPQFPVAIDDVASWQRGEKIDIFAGPHGLYQNTADPRLPSMRERYDAARRRASADDADHDDDDRVAAFDGGVLIDDQGPLSIGQGLSDEERALLRESLRLATLREANPTGSDGGESAASSLEAPVSAAAHRWMEQQFLRVDDRAAFDAEKPRFDMLVAELSRAPVEVHDFILDGFRDVLLSDHCLLFLRLALAEEQRRRREFQQTAEEGGLVGSGDRSMIFTSIANKAAQLHTQLMALIEEESLRHYQTIAEVCEISAMFQQADPLQFLDRLDAVKPKFDTDLLAFLNHNLFHDQQRLRRHDEAMQAMAYRPHAEPEVVEQRQGDLLPELEEKRLRRWVQVLRILQQGVTAELERRHELSIEMLTVLLRVYDPRIRRPLFERYVNMTATTDLQALRTLAVNMVERLLDAPTMRQDADIQRFWQSASMGGRTPAQWRLMLECLRREVDEFLSDAVIEERLRRYNEQLAEQGLTLGLRHRNPITQAAIESADRIDQRQIASGSQMTSDRLLPGQPSAPSRSTRGQPTTSPGFPTI